VDKTLSDFVRVLRGVGVRVSTSETIDAFHAVRLVGYSDRNLLKGTLASTLAKTSEESEILDGCFDRFFAFQNFTLEDAAEAEEQKKEQNDQDQDSPAGGGAGGGGGGGGEGQGSGGEGEGGEKMEASSPLGQLLLSDDENALTVEMAQAAMSAGIADIMSFTQRGRYVRAIAEAMGLAELDKEISEKSAGEAPEPEIAIALEQGRERLIEQVRDYVEEQIALFATAAGEQIRRRYLPRIKLSTMDKRNLKDMQELVRKMAKRLIALNSRKKTKTNRGQLDFRKTMRQGLPHGGLMFETHWKSTKVDRPKVFAICDVSGSVSAVSRFLLMFLYSVSEVLPKVRSFAFSSRLGEVTDLFERHDLEEAVAVVQQRFGNMSTDYGRSFQDFERLCLKEIDYRTTVIILGDARSNYGNPRTEILRDIYGRAKQVIWLNPESRPLWSLGDSEMIKYKANCTRVDVCNTLSHLERIVSDLLRSAS